MLRLRLPVSPEVHANAAIDGWTILRAGDPVSSSLGIPTVKTDINSAVGAVRLAVGPGGEPRVLLPLGEREAVRGIVEAPSLRIVVAQLTQAGKQLRFLDIMCTAHHLEPAFADVVEAILSRVEQGLSCVEAAWTTLEDFRSLLLVQADAGLAIERVAGLAGELLILNRLIDHSTAAWRAWRGPAGDRHDFRSGSTSLEVKATLKKGKSRIVVHGLNQLEPNTGGSLYLSHLTLEPSAAGLLSIAALAHRALSRVDNPGELQATLANAGCHDPSSVQWNKYQFNLEAEAFYEVCEGFPRLIPSSLVGGEVPVGVSTVAYEVDLASASSCLRDHVRQKSVEDELTRCL